MTVRAVGLEEAYDLANELVPGDEFKWYDRATFVEVTGMVDDWSQYHMPGYNGDTVEKVLEAEGSRGGEYLLVIRDSSDCGGFKEAVVFRKTGGGDCEFAAALKNEMVVEWK